MSNESNSAPRGALVRKLGQGRTVAVVGDIYRFLATGEETDGKFAMWEALVPPGGGPPPHVHSREEESFYVLEGEITFRYRGAGGAEQTLVAGPGMFAAMPVGVPHSFKNEGAETAKMILSVAPAGLEQMFFAVGTKVADRTATAAPPSKAEIEKLIALAPSYGVEILVPKH